MRLHAREPRYAARAKWNVEWRELGRRASATVRRSRVTAFKRFLDVAAARDTRSRLHLREPVAAARKKTPPKSVICETFYPRGHFAGI